MPEDIVKRKRGRPPKNQTKAEAIVQNIETPKPKFAEYPLSGYHGLRAVPKPTHQERSRDK